MYRRFIRSAVGRLGVVVLLGGCSTMPQLVSPVASYGPTTIFSPSGYGQTMLDDTHFQVQATGTEATPKARVEKIARARAAQIGVEKKHKYFKVASVRHGVACTERQQSHKSTATPASSRPTVVLDVIYAETPSDPAFTDSEATFQTLQSELGSEVVAPEAQAVAIKETRAGCGQGGGA